MYREARRRNGGRDGYPTTFCSYRYSALTFKGHRIHYDRRYATEVEGYPGLIVQGPLIATLLLDLMHWQRPEERLRLAFRLLSQV